MAQPKTKKKPEAKAKGKPAVGTPEFMAMIRQKRGKGKGKRKANMGKRELRKSINNLTKLVTRQGKALDRLLGAKKKKPKKK